jgi:hypothetical protein
MSVLIDDDARPALREHIGRLLSTCTTADIAVGHIRLAALDLDDRETRAVRRCRILLGRLDARALSDVGFDNDYDERGMQTLCAFLESGRIEIRSAGLGAWAPDFSVYRGLPDGGGAVLIGAHYFRAPPMAHGPSFTALLTDGHSVATAAARFEALWRRSHDVHEPVITAVRRRQSFSAA